MASKADYIPPKIALDRPQLQFGPYRAPDVKVGQVIQCERQGQAKVRGWSGGEIPWPVSRRSETSPVLILCGDLVRAVQSESALAVALAWGVSRITVGIWRQVLKVPRANTGSQMRWRDNFPQVLSQAQHEEGMVKAHDLTTRQKAEATKRERDHVPNRHKWTQAELALLGTMSDEELAQRLGCHTRTVANERKRRGITARSEKGGVRHGPAHTVKLDRERVRARRLELGISQGAVAARFGCRQAQISAFENGTRQRVSEKTLERLSKALGLGSPDALIVPWTPNLEPSKNQLSNQPANQLSNQRVAKPPKKISS